MGVLILKELREFLYNPKFLTTFIVSTVLILISLFNGYTVYSESLKTSRSGAELALQDARGEESFEDFGDKGIRVLREPDRLTIFDVGISGAIGRKSTVTLGGRPRSRDSRYSADPVLAVFGELDITFIVSIILSLFAILFSYNAISGERELGTLRQIIAYSVKRPSVITSKLIGGYLPLVITFLAPLVLGLSLLLVLTDVQFTSGEWIRIVFMVAASLLYLLVFYTIGLAMSALTKNSFISFLMCLFIWVFSVAIIPRISVHSASLVSPSFSTDEIDSQALAFRRDLLRKNGEYIAEYFKNNPTKPAQMQTDMGGYLRYVRRRMQEDRVAFEDNLYVDLLSKRKTLLETAMNFSRLSPTSSYSMTMHSLANTGPGLIDRFEDDLLRYRQIFKSYIETNDKPKKLNLMNLMNRMGVKFGTDENGYMKVTPVEIPAPPELDISGLPRFSLSEPSVGDIVNRTLPDFTIMALMSILFFAVAYVAFLRYDVR